MTNLLQENIEMKANAQAYTFAIRTSRHTNPKLQKSMLFANALIKGNYYA